MYLAQTKAIGPYSERGILVAQTYVPSVLKAVLISAVMLGGSGFEMLAQSAGTAPGARAAAVVHIPGAAAFDWLAKKRVSKAGQVQSAVLVSAEGQTVVQRKRFFGKGSWICSPAGFGKKSRCFAR